MTLKTFLFQNLKPKGHSGVTRMMGIFCTGLVAFSQGEDDPDESNEDAPIQPKRHHPTGFEDEGEEFRQLQDFLTRRGKRNP
jgi:hypothetical protein